MPSLRQLVKSCVAPAASCRRFERPIFILAPPRSGSAFLFECLCQFEEVVHLEAEADAIWWQHFPYEGMAQPSDHVDAAAVSAAVRRGLCRQLYREAVINRLRQRPSGARLPPSSGPRVDPLPRQDDRQLLSRRGAGAALSGCALPVFLVRDPRANIASMIEGWPYLERFGKAQLTPCAAAARGEDDRALDLPGAARLATGGRPAARRDLRLELAAARRSRAGVVRTTRR